MRNYPRVGGRKGKPGYRTPRSFLHKFVKLTSKVSQGKVYGRFKGYLAKIAKNKFTDKDIPKK